MKNFKKLVLGLVVAVMAIGFSAFTNAHKNVVTDWYKPASTILLTSPDRLDFSNYNPTPQNEPTDCGASGTKVCAAEFPNTSSAPTLIYSRK